MKFLCNNAVTFKAPVNSKMNFDYQIEFLEDIIKQASLSIFFDFISSEFFAFLKLIE